MRITNQEHLNKAVSLIGYFQIAGLPISTKAKLEVIVNQLLDDATKPACELLEFKAVGNG